MATEMMDKGRQLLFGVIVAGIVYQVIQGFDFGTGIVDTIMNYVVPLFALGLVTTVTE